MKVLIKVKSNVASIGDVIRFQFNFEEDDIILPFDGYGDINYNYYFISDKNYLKKYDGCFIEGVVMDISKIDKLPLISVDMEDLDIIVRDIKIENIIKK